MSAERDESFLTVAEVADWLKVNQQTVRNWIDHGTLPAIRVGRRVRIKRSDLDRILEAGYQGGSVATPGRPAGPSAQDFWSGEPVGMADADPSAPPAQAPVRPVGDFETASPPNGPGLAGPDPASDGDRDDGATGDEPQEAP